MASYWNHKRTVTRTIPYEFTCEQCLKHSGLLTAEIKVEAEKRSMFKNLNEKDSAALVKDADEIMEATMRRVYRDAVDKDDFSEEFKDVCPNCGKPQTWGIKGMGHIPWFYGAVTGIVTGVVGVYYAVYASLNVVAFLTFALIFAVIGFIVGKIRIMIKKSKTKGAEPRLPVIHWPDDVA